MSDCLENPKVKFEPLDDEARLVDVLPHEFYLPPSPLLSPTYEPILPISPIPPVFDQHLVLTAEAQLLFDSLNRVDQFTSNLNGIVQKRCSRKGRKSRVVTKEVDNDKKSTSSIKRKNNKSSAKDRESVSAQPYGLVHSDFKENILCMLNDQTKANSEFCPSLTESNLTIFDIASNATNTGAIAPQSSNIGLVPLTPTTAEIGGKEFVSKSKNVSLECQTVYCSEYCENPSTSISQTHLPTNAPSNIIIQSPGGLTVNTTIQQSPPRSDENTYEYSLIVRRLNSICSPVKSMDKQQRESATPPPFKDILCQANGPTQAALPTQEDPRDDSTENAKSNSIQVSAILIPHSETDSHDQTKTTISTVSQAISFIVSKINSGEISLPVVLFRLITACDREVTETSEISQLQNVLSAQKQLPNVLSHTSNSEVSTIKPLIIKLEDDEEDLCQVLDPVEASYITQAFTSSECVKSTQPTISQALELTESNSSILKSQLLKPTQPSLSLAEAPKPVESNLLITNQEQLDSLQICKAEPRTAVKKLPKSNVFLVESNLLTPIADNSTAQLLRSVESEFSGLTLSPVSQAPSKQAEFKLKNSKNLDSLQLSKPRESNIAQTTKPLLGANELATELSQSSEQIGISRTSPESMSIQEPFDEDGSRKIDKTNQQDSDKAKLKPNKRCISASLQTDNENSKNRSNKSRTQVTTPEVVFKEQKLKAKRSKSFEDTNLLNQEFVVKIAKLSRRFSSKDEVDLDQIIPKKKSKKSKESNSNENNDIIQQNLRKSTYSNVYTKPNYSSVSKKEIPESKSPVQIKSTKVMDNSIIESDIIKKLPKIPKKSSSIDEGRSLEEEKRIDENKHLKYSSTLETNKNKVINKVVGSFSKQIVKIASPIKPRISECGQFLINKDLFDKVNKKVYNDETKFVRTLLSIPPVQLSTNEDSIAPYIQQHYKDWLAYQAEQVLPRTFQSIDQYKSYFASLLVYETWANICKKYRELDKKPKPSWKKKVNKIEAPIETDQMCCVQLKGLMASNEWKNIKYRSTNWIAILHVEGNHSDDFILCFIKRILMSDETENEVTTTYIHLKIYVDSKHKLAIEQATDFTISPLFNLYFILGKISTMSKIEAKPDLLKLIISPTSKNFCHHETACTTNFRFFDCSEYSHSQKKAIISGYNMIHQDSKISQEGKFVIVHGLPGTGKTHTLVGLIKNLFLNNLYANDNDDNPLRIMVCASSNYAVDEISRRLIHLRNQLNEVHAARRTIRLVRLDRPEYTDAGIRELVLEEQLKKPSEQCVSAHHFHYNRSRESSIGSILKKADVIVSSFNTLLNTDRGIAMKLLNKEIAIKCLIVDDASHCMEPEFLKPLTIPSISKVIMFGDHQQFNVSLISAKALEGNLNRSLFERFYLCLDGNKIAQHNNAVIHLTSQFRMQPDIWQFPSQQFYQAQSNLEPGWIDEDFPLNRYCIFDTIDWPQRAELAENVLARNLVAAIYKSLGDKPLNFSLVIIVLTAWQKTKLMKHLWNCLNPEQRKWINLKTVDEFQGQESDIVIVCCSQDAKELKRGPYFNLHRLNLAFTRARKALFVCLDTRNFSWHDLLYNAERRQLYHKISNLSVEKLTTYIST